MFLVKSIVFFMISMMVFHSIDPPDVLLSTRKIDSSDNITFVNQAVFEHDAGDKEGRISGLANVTLYRSQIPDMDLADLSGVPVKFNPSNIISLFKSIAFDLPSPPPKG